MLNVTFIRVREDAVAPLRRWLRELAERRDELRRSYRDQGTRHEKFFLLRAGDQDVLVLVTELEDLQSGAESFLHSHMPLDAEFKRLIQEASLGEVEPERIYDSDDVLGDAAA